MDYQNLIQHPSHKPRIISVVGNSKIEVKPDYAELQIEVVTQSSDLSTAQRENAQRMNQVIQALLTLNINRNDIQTAFFNVFPRYDFVEGKQVFREYEVSNGLTVNVHDVNSVGIVIDTAIKNGANRISQLEFKLANDSLHYQKALQLALQNAHEKADAIASSLRLTYKPLPVEIIEETSGGPILLRTVAVTQSSFETPIEQGMISVEATLNVKYQF
ncbi:SIMPL domain-containing protein [Ureibacillus chungkukjangi]|uniref:SIMPL domain-containing protein n=1 Tax=Ureibacillus chungkukjangi TaxID=1202712 RepID=UPI00203DB88B|nr:SIMPL domain-containing protein [Ureibacillus chungkukjangi]MCM3388030.1 SIMPL domain-containing protein [Ureibacillus chungkukjangi]